MSYNWKCCSFYPNNFDASALRSGYDDHQASLTRQRGCADSMVGVAVYDPAHRSGVGDPIVIK